jgi:hypothetical protein
MTSDQMFAQMRGKQAAQLRACFPGLAERDLMQILCSTPQHAVYILQQCFGCDQEDAKAAWNEYVLRYIDGAPAAGEQRAIQPKPPAHLL